MATRTASGQPTIPSWGFYAWIGILGVLVLQGLYSFFRQTFEGHYLTGLSNATPWGLYIAAFVFFIGASAGATVIGLMIHAFGREDYAPLGTRAILVALFALAGAVLLIAVDVGSIPRMLRMPLIWRNPTSPLMYTSMSYYLFSAMLLGGLYYTIKLTRGLANDRDKKIAKWLAIATVPVALVIVQATDGIMFAVVIARELWNTPLLPPHFAVASLATGTSVMILMALVTSRVSGKELVSKRTLAHMGGLLAVFIGIAGFLDVFDLIVFMYSDQVGGNDIWHVLNTDNLALTVLHVGGYIIAFVILLSKWRHSIRWLTVASVLALVALAAYRYNLTTVGLAVPLFPFIPEVNYTPTMLEISLTVGILALVTLGYSIVTKVLPMEKRADS
ncbi:MAG: NrfD/PsrC family molybdoenzyme membrane anchor subunit [Dehalococcoidia bacterium]